MPSFGGESEAYFSSIQNEYDSLIRRAVPCYNEMLDALVTYLPENPTRILELGSGTGNLSLSLLERFTEATLVGVDVSARMLALTTTRARSRGWGDRWEEREATFEDLVCEEGSFDLIVSSISLHHVKDKPALFARVRSWLSESGEFWLADQMWTAMDRSASHNWEHWKAYCREPGNCTEEELRGLIEHAEAHDHYEPMMSYLRTLEGAGFDPTSIDCVWRSTMWGIAGARR
ncbi:MAG: class I SAM-dependent methyltransferase [Planctomycetota bacterium]|jgi:ubiquinone/menaquinone biosynthesis C-methylase UbiE